LGRLSGGSSDGAATSLWSRYVAAVGFRFVPPPSRSPITLFRGSSSSLQLGGLLAHGRCQGTLAAPAARASPDQAVRVMARGGRGAQASVLASLLQPHCSPYHCSPIRPGPGPARRHLHHWRQQQQQQQEHTRHHVTAAPGHNLQPASQPPSHPATQPPSFLATQPASQPARIQRTATPIHAVAMPQRGNAGRSSLPWTRQRAAVAQGLLLASVRLCALHQALLQVGGGGGCRFPDERAPAFRPPLLLTAPRWKAASRFIQGVGVRVIGRPRVGEAVTGRASTLQGGRVCCAAPACGCCCPPSLPTPSAAQQQPSASCSGPSNRRNY
jgi:hypothetical protein